MNRRLLLPLALYAGLTFAASWAAFHHRPLFSMATHEKATGRRPSSALLGRSFVKQEGIGAQPDLPSAIQFRLFSGGLSVVKLFPGKSEALSGLGATSEAGGEISTGNGDPLAGCAYAGSVTIDGRTLALIEKSSTHEGWYVGEGDLWQGYPVTSVDADQMTIRVGGEPRILVKSEAFNTLPLLADAPTPPPSTRVGDAAQTLVENMDKEITLRQATANLSEIQLTYQQDIAQAQQQLTIMDTDGMEPAPVPANPVPTDVDSYNLIY